MFRSTMDWSATSATKAYIDTIQLCNNYRRQYEYDSWRMQENGSNEFVSALAAGMKAKLIVEVTSRASPSTIALAAAARQTGGRVVCILPEVFLDESEQVIRNLGLEDQVEFRTEDPSKLLLEYENIDFSLVDCKDENNTRLLDLIDVNPTRAVVVANNLVGGRKRLRGRIRAKDENVAITSLKHPIGKSMEVTVISKNDEGNKRIMVEQRHSQRKRSKSRWVAKFDEESGEEHIFRVPDYVGEQLT
ncbi:hypothetical protein L6164_004029 [Bauhinia variegata]|uniref:Uncharacterized protein n=1 Tax=Bauhinia variegata TaxID=167791 RepID=A0ACB9Q373_BAUVA|nr:hypothetical protein L6164_004029 [Bauhinia variegata]